MDALLENERRSGNQDREEQLHNLQNLRSSINQSLTGRREVGESSPRREEQLRLAEISSISPEVIKEFRAIIERTLSPNHTIAEVAAITPEQARAIMDQVGQVDIPTGLEANRGRLFLFLTEKYKQVTSAVAAVAIAVMLMSSLPREASAQSGVPTPTATIQAGENPLLNATPTPEPIDSNDQLNGEDAALVSESNQEEAGQEESAVVQSKLEISPVIKSYRVLTDTLPLLSPYDATTVMADVEFKEGDSIQSATSMIINGEEFIAVKVVLTPDDTAPQADDDKPVDDELTAESNEEPEVKYVWVPKRNLEEKEQVTITKTVKEAVILAAALNVRSGPGTNHAVVGSLKAGDRVEIVGEEDGWYIVNLEGVGQAYISADPNLTKQESKDVSVTTGQEVNSNLEKYASTNDEDEASTGMGGKIEPDQLLALAVEKFPDSAVSIYIDSEKGPIALDTNGNELGRFDNGKWKTMEEVSAKRYTAAELLAEFGENEMVKEALDKLPDELLLPNFETNKSEPTELNSKNYTFWFEGERLFAQAKAGDKLIDMNFVEFKHRNNWQIFQFGSEKIDFYLDADYNYEHPVRLMEEESRYVQCFEPATAEDILSSTWFTKWMVDNPDMEKWYADYHFLNPNQEPILESEFNTQGFPLDHSINEFFKILEESESVMKVSGKFVFESGLIIDPNQKISFRLTRFPDIDKKVGGWLDDVRGTMSANPYQVDEIGKLYIDATISETPNDWNTLLVTTRVLAMILDQELGLEPDKLDPPKNSPMYYRLNEGLVRIILTNDGKRVIVPPLKMYTSGEPKGRMSIDSDR